MKNVDNISEIGIYVSNINEAREFYERILDFSIVDEYSNEGYCLLRLKNVLLSLKAGGFKADGVKSKDQSPLLIRLYADSIDELKELTENLKSNKIQIVNDVMETDFGTITTFTDKDGNRLEYIVRKLT